jgi:hypothetical protein
MKGKKMSENTVINPRREFHGDFVTEFVDEAPSEEQQIPSEPVMPEHGNPSETPTHEETLDRDNKINGQTAKPEDARIVPEDLIVPEADEADAEYTQTVTTDDQDQYKQVVEEDEIDLKKSAKK